MKQHFKQLGVEVLVGLSSAKQLPSVQLLGAPRQVHTKCRECERKRRQVSQGRTNKVLPLFYGNPLVLKGKERPGWIFSLHVQRPIGVVVNLKGCFVFSHGNRGWETTPLLQIPTFFEGYVWKNLVFQGKYPLV